MIILIAFIIIVVMIFAAFLIFKILKDQNEMEKDDIKEDIIEREENQKEIIEVISEKKFQELMEQVSKNPEKLEELKKSIQDALRKSVKEKNVFNARVCNMQLKRLDNIGKRGKQD